MWKSSVLFCCLTIFFSVQGLTDSATHRVTDEPSMKMNKLNKTELKERWIQQQLDHFDVENNKTWLMRYYKNAEFFNGSGPIYILFGGEQAISSGYLKYGFMHEMARNHGAIMYCNEHRYYGKSHPVENTVYKNLEYLHLEQILADIAFFIESKKQELNAPNARVILFGVSYAGNLAAWMRIKYPNLVQGALAISAPVYVKADATELTEFSADRLRQYDVNCATNIAQAFSAVERLLKGSMKDLAKLQRDFKLCSTLECPRDSGRPFMILALFQIFEGAVTANSIASKSSITKLCDLMNRNGTNTSPYKNLGEAFWNTYGQSNYSCINLKYLRHVWPLQETSWQARKAQGPNKALMMVGFNEELMGNNVLKLSFFAARTWLYQSCTNYGYWQTSSPKSIFGTLLSVNYYIFLCKHIFSVKYDVNTLYDNIRRINATYNSKLPDVKNIIFTNGDLDMWKSLSVLSDLNEDSPSILINGSTHGELFRPSIPTDNHSLKDARHRAASIISKWIRADG